MRSASGMATDSTIVRQTTRSVTFFRHYSANRLCFPTGFEGDITLLDDKVHLHRLPDRYTLVKEGESLNKLFFVVHGSIVSYMKEISGSKKERRARRKDLENFEDSLGRILGVMFVNRANEISGLVSVLTGGLYLSLSLRFFDSISLTIEPTLFTYRTHGLTDICTITKENFYDLMRIQPNLVLSIAASE